MTVRSGAWGVVGALGMVAASSVAAATGDGGAPGDLLSLAVGARALGMAQAYTAAGGDAGAILGNPADLARLLRPQAIAGDALLPEGFNDGFLGFAWPTVRFGTFGLGVARFSAGQVAARDAENQLLPQTVTVDHTGAVASYGADLGVLLVGASAVFLQQTGPSTSQQGFTGSIGLTTDFGRFAPALLGASAGVRVGGIVPAKLGTAAVPLSIRPGVAYRALSDNLTVAADADLTTNHDLRYAVGAEYTYRRMVSVRAGWNGAPAGGVGFRLGSVQADYAVGALPLGLSHRASLSLDFGSSLGVPSIEVREPVADASGRLEVGSSKITLDVTVSSRDPLERVQIAGHAMKITDRSYFRFQSPLGLREGRNVLRVEAVTQGGQQVVRALDILVSTHPPEIQVLDPRPGSSIKGEEITVHLLVSGVAEVSSVSVNDLPAIISPGTRVEVTQPVVLQWGGKNVIRIAASDRWGHLRTLEIPVNREGGPPQPVSPQDRQRAELAANARQSVERAKEFARKGDLDAAEFELKYALRLSPGFPEAQKALDAVQQERARRAPAPVAGQEPTISGVSEEVRRAMEAHFAHGKQLLEAGKFKDAQREFELVLELNRQYATAADLLDQCKKKLQDYVARRLRDARAARAAGQLPKEISALRDVLAADEKLPEANAMMSEASSQVPLEIRRMHHQALQLYADGKLDEAVQIWQQAQELDPYNDEVKTALEKAQRQIIETKGR